MSDEELLEFMEEEGGVAYATWNPADKDANITLAGDDLIATTSATSKGVRSTISKSTDNWYVEITMGSTGAAGGVVGFATAAEPLASLMINVFGWGFYSNTSRTFHLNTQVVGGLVAPNPDDVAMLALNADLGLGWTGLNGSWHNSGNPATGANPMFSSLPNDIFINASLTSTAQILTLNAGASAFAHAVPSGFNPGLYE